MYTYREVFVPRVLTENLFRAFDRIATAFEVCFGRAQWMGSVDQALAAGQCDGIDMVGQCPLSGRRSADDCGSLLSLLSSRDGAAVLS
jgi:hypothetical protein